MEKERKNKTNVLTGSAGEYFVAAELSRRGVVAALTMSGTDAFDILAVNKAGCSYSIQVKTTQYEKELRWLLCSKDEKPKADFYVFVNLNGTEKQPDYYIMPAAEVAAAIKEEHETWLATPKRDGTAHKPINMRQIILDQQDVSKGKWELITGETQNGKE
mgnify:FL=1